MSPEECIAALDDALAEAGEDVVLRRVVGRVNIDCSCRAFMKTYRLHEQDVVSGVAQSVDIFVLSPSDIARAQWPGGELPSLTVVHPNFPRRGDKLIVHGRVREIESCVPKTMGTTVVRFDGQLT